MKERKKNPIDKDKIAENPGLLPYASNVGSVQIKPIDKGRVKGNAMAAMVEQTHMHMNQIREQIELLMSQAQELQRRVDISQRIYDADTNFEPVIGKFYHLYARKNDQWVLSMLAPEEWGRRIPFKEYIASVKLLSDHTWEIITGEEESFLENLERE